MQQQMERSVHDTTEGRSEIVFEKPPLESVSSKSNKGQLDLDVLGVEKGRYHSCNL